MANLTIYGASDDLVEIEPMTDGLDEIPVIGEPCVLKLTESNGPGGCLITIEYRDGLWQATVGLLDEDVVIPWNIEVRHHPQVGYSVKVVVEDFDGHVERVAPDGGES